MTLPTGLYSWNVRREFPWSDEARGAVQCVCVCVFCGVVGQKQVICRAICPKLHSVKRLHFWRTVCPQCQFKHRTWNSLHLITQLNCKTRKNAGEQQFTRVLCQLWKLFSWFISNIHKQQSQFVTFYWFKIEPMASPRVMIQWMVSNCNLGLSQVGFWTSRAKCAATAARGNTTVFTPVTAARDSSRGASAETGPTSVNPALRWGLLLISYLSSFKPRWLLFSSSSHRPESAAAKVQPL